MRIAIFENLPSGGAKRAAYEFGRFLVRRHEVDLYRLSTTSTRAFDLAHHVRAVYVYRYAPFFGLLNGRLARGKLAPRSLTLFRPLQRVHRQIARDLSERHYDVVLAHTDSMTQSPYLLRWLRDTPNLYYCHDVLRVAQERRLLQLHRQMLGSSPWPLGPLRVAEDRLVLRRWIAADLRNVQAATEIAVNSRHTRERVWSAYGRMARTCYPGVDTERFSPALDRDRRREVLSIGSPLFVKGHDLVIEALAWIPGQSRPRLRIIAPSSTGADDLKRLAQNRGVEMTIESGIDEAALLDRYRHAIATVCAARLEPFGYTALESTACGTPVIAIDEGGFRETVCQRKTGLLVDPDPAAVAEGIAELVGNPDLVEMLGRQGRERVLQCWTWERSGRRLETLLARAAGR